MSTSGDINGEACCPCFSGGGLGCVCACHRLAAKYACSRCVTGGCSCAARNIAAVLVQQSPAERTFTRAEVLVALKTLHAARAGLAEAITAFERME